MQHIGKPPNVKYIARWYGYEASDDSVEPPENLPVNFIARYYRTVANRFNLFGPLIYTRSQEPLI